MAGRSANMTAAERNLLVELVQKYADVLENKETDKLTLTQKNAAWCRLVDEHNAVSCHRRTTEQVKQVDETFVKALLKYTEYSLYQHHLIDI